MKKVLVGIGILLLVIVLAVAGLYLFGHAKVNSALSQVKDYPPLNISASDGDTATGQRIAMIRNGCFHCHGGDFGGFTFIDDPLMGQIAGGNITPKVLGSWTDEEIARAIHYGIRKDNTPLIFMPSHEFQYLSKGDVASVILYLRTLPSAERPSPPIKIGVLGKILFGLGQLPTLVPAHSLIKPDMEFVTKPEEGSTVEFGKYLVSSSCVGCHGEKLQGGPIPGAPPDWPAASRLNNLSETHSMDDFKKVLKTGIRMTGEKLRPPMSDAPTDQMTDVEMEAIWKYLDSLKGAG